VTQPLLRATGVARTFGDVKALAPTDVELQPGETVALVGPNGAGKSTLLAILAGALEPSAGVVDAHASIGWVPQRPAHYARLSARENLELFAQLEGVRDSAGTAARLLERFSLPAEHRASGELSVGNRQRLNVALSLIGDPRVLLLDEPTASLDPGQRRRVWDVVDELRADGGAVCFATQNLEEVEHANRVLVLSDGHIVSATVEEVFFGRRLAGARQEAEGPASPAPERE
jgi:ABC-2 type transport system ATP-binding protein